MGRVVLVTGVSRFLGGAFARRLARDPGVERVIGVDVVAPPHDLGDADFVRADIRNPVIGRVLASEAVDTVVHMGVIATPRQAGGRSSMKEINVIGTMQLLAACQRSDALERVVVKSTTSVYGAGPKDPAMFTEDMDPRHAPTSGWPKDSLEVEGYVRGFSRRRPDVAVATVRLANVIGPRITTGMTDYVTLPVVPTVLGHDARLQFLHEDDATDVLALTALGEATGTFNVAGDGILMLSQALRRAGRPTLPVASPLFPLAGRAVRRLGIADFSAEQVRFLTYGRGVDTTRMREVLGFEPAHTTEEAFDSFVEARGLNTLLPAERVAAVEAQVLELLGRGSHG